MYRDDEEWIDKIVETTDDETKLAITAWVMKHIIEHATEGGSFRYLIYDRLGFGPEAYVPLCADGLTISNEFDLNLRQKLFDLIEKNKYDKLKSLVGICDEDGCYRSASCGWPSEDGYRHTCFEHMEKKDD